MRQVIWEWSGTWFVKAGQGVNAVSALTLHRKSKQSHTQASAQALKPSINQSIKQAITQAIKPARQNIAASRPNKSTHQQSWHQQFRAFERSRGRRADLPLPFNHVTSKQLQYQALEQSH
jgi:hypothetical protein